MARVPSSVDAEEAVHEMDTKKYINLKRGLSEVPDIQTDNKSTSMTGRVLWDLEAMYETHLRSLDMFSLSIPKNQNKARNAGPPPVGAGFDRSEACRCRTGRWRQETLQPVFLRAGEIFHVVGALRNHSHYRDIARDRLGAGTRSTPAA